MRSISNPLEFAEFTFGSADLGDKRRTKRLVNGAAALAKHPGLSIPGACEDDGARLEGLYKLIRNDEVCPKEIRKAAYISSSVAAKDVAGDILLIHDTTSISPVHSLRDQLRSKKGSPCGYEVHTGMLVGVDDGAPIGVLGQLVWSRNKVAQKKPLFEKESDKWQQLDEQVDSQSLDSSLSNRMIRVADREADYFSYMTYLEQTDKRFVIRAAQNRLLKSGDFRYVWDAANAAPIMGTRAITIEQRGAQKKSLEQEARKARPRREVMTTHQATTVTIKEPNGTHTIKVNLVYVTADDEDLEWLLLTKEPISTQEEVEKIVTHYEKRWLIEQFHKAWKTDCKIEERRMGTLDNFLRIMAITMPIALGLLRLQVCANRKDADAIPATKALSKTLVEVLWYRVEKKPFPEHIPSCRWAYRSIGKIAGWTDSKRTGRIGLDTLYRGYQILITLEEGWTAAQKYKKLNDDQ